ncbi:MAG: hypothetical protein ACP5N9_06095 [Candidatus Bilamarchaeum sp.]|jgi:quercetin dioxygenase-like cupin family protein
MDETKKGVGKLTCLSPGKSSGKIASKNGHSMITVFEGQATVIHSQGKKTLPKGESVFIPYKAELEIKNETEKDLIYVLISGRNKK